MNEHEHLKLLNDVFREGRALGARDEFLAETMVLARRRRQVRQVRKATAGLLLIVAAVTLVWHKPRPRQKHDVAEAPKLYETIQSHALVANAVVVSSQSPDLQMVTSFSSATVLTTAGALIAKPKLVGDDELLTLCAPRPAVLVRESPQSAELVFLDKTP